MEETEKKIMSLQAFQKIVLHLLEASKIVAGEIPMGCLEKLAWDMNITQAVQWVRNFRENQQPKDYVISQEALEKQVNDGKQRAASELKSV